MEYYKNNKLKKIIDMRVFEALVLEGKKGIFTDELYNIGEKIWQEAQRDLIEKIEQFEKDEKLLIVTESDRELLHGFDITQEEHIKAKLAFTEFLDKNKR